MSKRPLSLLSVLILCIAFYQPARAAGDPTIFEFLRLEASARAASLGNAFITFRNDPAILFHNPGGISTVLNPSGSFGFIKHLLDVNAGYAVYVQEVEDIGWIGGGVTYFNYGSNERRDKFANDLGTFGAGDLAITAGYGNRSDEIYYGGNVKFIYSSIDNYSASAVAIDAGVTYLIPTEQIAIAVSILNLGTQLSTFTGTRESLPFDMRIGISKQLEHLPLLLNLNFHKLNESQESIIKHLNAFSIGGEFTLSDELKLRLGYNNEKRRELKVGSSAGLTGFSAGLGLGVSGYLVDYSFSSFGAIGALHRFSVSTSF